MSKAKKRILIIGGYGNFGSYISRQLVKENDLTIIVAGRSQEKGREFATEIGSEYAVLDVTQDLGQSLSEIKPDIVIHTSGPFQGQGYDVVHCCIDYGCHYLDLSDGREFVTHITKLNDLATEKNLCIISGASSVPALSSAVIDYFKPQFKTITDINYGIATAQQTNRGLATTSAILSYTGKGFQTKINGEMKTVYGWQDFHFHKYPEIGYRALGNCDIPDLSLFPHYYPDIKTIRFFAGTEIFFMHIGLWLMSWLVRFKIIKSLKPWGRVLLKISKLFDNIGSSNSAFHMKLSGTDNKDKALSKTFYILARNGDGPFIPCAPSIILAKQIARGEFTKTGAYPCVGLIDLGTFEVELSGFDIDFIS